MYNSVLEQAKNTASNLYHNMVESGKGNNHFIELSFVFEENSKFLTLVEGKGAICKVKDLLNIEEWIGDVDIIWHNVEGGEHKYSVVKIHHLTL